MLELRAGETVRFGYAPISIGHGRLNTVLARSTATVVVFISDSSCLGLPDILAHPNQAKYPRQRVLLFACDNYAYLVPVEEEDYFFPKTVIPSRKATRGYSNQGETDAEN